MTAAELATLRSIREHIREARDVFSRKSAATEAACRKAHIDAVTLPMDTGPLGLRTAIFDLAIAAIKHNGNGDEVLTRILVTLAWIECLIDLQESRGD